MRRPVLNRNSYSLSIVHIPPFCRLYNACKGALGTRRNVCREGFRQRHRQLQLSDLKTHDQVWSGSGKFLLQSILAYRLNKFRTPLFSAIRCLFQALARLPQLLSGRPRHKAQVLSSFRVCLLSFS